MKRSVLFLLLATNCILLSGKDAGDPGKKPVYLFSKDLNSDPLTGRKYNVVIKGNVLQVLFSEAPFSIEVFGKNDMSQQFQVGIIFPLEDDSFLQDLFPTSGTNGIFSYRNSPYNNHGMSFKYELRKYREQFYFAPQVVFKYLGYNKTAVSGKKNIKESKFSKVFGLGMMVGRQTYFRGQAIDCYSGIGVRTRHMSIETHDSEYLKTQTGNELTSPKEIVSVYPYVNFGFRIGIVVW